MVQVEDVDERRATAERLRLEALHDALTGLPNRRAITAELEELVGAPGHDAALLMLDLDGFKAVNDRLVHDAGDELLQVVADRLRSCLHPGDVAGRLAGDEFVVVARGAPDDLGQRVLSALVGPAALRAGSVALRASVGVRRITGDDREVRAVVRDADASLYRAKHDGGCCSRVAEPGEGDVRDTILAPGPSPRLSVRRPVATASAIFTVDRAGRRRRPAEGSPPTQLARAAGSVGAVLRQVPRPGRGRSS